MYYCKVSCIVCFFSTKFNQKWGCLLYIWYKNLIIFFQNVLLNTIILYLSILCVMRLHLIYFVKNAWFLIQCPCIGILIHCFLHQTSSCLCICHIITSHLLTRCVLCWVVDICLTIAVEACITHAGLHSLIKCNKILKLQWLN